MAGHHYRHLPALPLTDLQHDFLQDFVVHIGSGFVRRVDGVLVPYRASPLTLLLHVRPSHKLTPKIEVVSSGMLHVAHHRIVSALYIVEI